jgi:hypothetical protein
MGIFPYDIHTVVVRDIPFLKSCWPKTTIWNFSGAIRISAGSMTSLKSFQRCQWPRWNRFGEVNDPLKSFRRRQWPCWNRYTWHFLIVSQFRDPAEIQILLIFSTNIRSYARWLYFHAFLSGNSLLGLKKEKKNHKTEFKNVCSANGSIWVLKKSVILSWRGNLPL